MTARIFPYAHYEIGSIKLETEAPEEYRVSFTPPIIVQGADFSDQGESITLGRLGMRAVMNDQAPPIIAALTTPDRRAYAEKIEHIFNATLGRDTATHRYDDVREHAAAIYGAFLAIGVLAVVETPEQYVAPPLSPEDRA